VRGSVSRERLILPRCSSCQRWRNSHLCVCVWGGGG
jgi:hypothetical protein